VTWPDGRKSKPLRVGGDAFYVLRLDAEPAGWQPG
jgi:hypothetical protein